MSDFKIFQQTSNEPYDRHTYEIVLKSKKRLKFEYYEEAQEYWFEHWEIPDYLDILEVKDKKKKDKKSNKGFS